MAKPTYNDEQKQALIAEFEASGKSMNAFVKGDGKPSYPAFKRWYEDAKGGAHSKAKSGVVDKPLDVSSILAESKAKLNAGRQALLKRKDDLNQQLKDTDAEIIKINEALERLG